MRAALTLHRDLKAKVPPQATKVTKCTMCGREKNRLPAGACSGGVGANTPGDAFAAPCRSNHNTTQATPVLHVPLGSDTRFWIAKQLAFLSPTPKAREQRARGSSEIPNQPTPHACRSPRTRQASLPIRWWGLAGAYQTSFLQRLQNQDAKLESKDTGGRTAAMRHTASR